MKKEENNLYYADEGNTLVRKSDGFNIGNGLCLSETDSIDNYEERPMSEEEKADYENEMAQYKTINKKKRINI